MGDTLLIHVHIPKCAETTIEKHLKSQLEDKEMWMPKKRTRQFPLGWLWHKYDPRLLGSTEQVRAISGHFIGQSIEKMFPKRRIVRSVILRGPESFMLSYYNFRMMRYLREASILIRSHYSCAPCERTRRSFSAGAMDGVAVDRTRSPFRRGEKGDTR
jgi:hypothetical protein